MNNIIIGIKAIVMLSNNVIKIATNAGPIKAPAFPKVLKNPKNSPVFSFGTNFPNKLLEQA